MNDRIYLSPPHVNGSEKALLLEALESNWIAPMGPQVDGFEAEIAEAVGVGHAVATSTGTAALHLALLALGVQAGDIVIAPTFTFIASVNPALYVGAEPWLIDVDRATWTMSPDLLAEALETAAADSRRVGAVISVDLYGQCADYDRIEAVCADHGVPLVEDAAQAIGSTFRHRPAGSFGTVGMLSFNGNKIVTTSGGGALASNDPEIIARAKHLASQAREPVVHYEHTEVGYNYRLSNLLAAVGRAQLTDLKARVDARRTIFDTYADQLGDLRGIEFLGEAPHVRSNRWLTTATIDPDAFGADRDTVIGALEAQNIEARPVWKPMHRQPVLAGCRTFGGRVADALFTDGVCLPSGTGMTVDQIDRVCDVVRSSAR